MSAYAAFFLNTSSSVVQLELLQISHSKFSQTYYVVRNAIKGLAAVTHEDSTVHAYQYYPLKIVPTSNAQDLDQTLEITFGDLGQVLPQELDNLMSPGGGAAPFTLEKPVIMYRTYRSDDLSVPLFGPYRFVANTIAFVKEGATLQCSAPRLNLNATGELYTMDRFPMLAGFL